MSAKTMMIGRLKYRFSHHTHTGAEAWEHVTRSKSGPRLYFEKGKWRSNEYGIRGRRFKQPEALMRTLYEKKLTELERYYLDRLAEVEKLNPLGAES